LIPTDMHNQLKSLIDQLIPLVSLVLVNLAGYAILWIRLQKQKLEQVERSAHVISKIEEAKAVLSAKVDENTAVNNEQIRVTNNFTERVEDVKKTAVFAVETASDARVVAKTADNIAVSSIADVLRELKELKHEVATVKERQAEIHGLVSPQRPIEIITTKS
jgi:hypothetical protein